MECPLFLDRLEQLLIAIVQNARCQQLNDSFLLRDGTNHRLHAQRIDSEVMLVEMAECVSASPFYLSKTFREVTDDSVIRYFSKIKVDKGERVASGERAESAGNGAVAEFCR
ncbi:hypothetical protein D3C81_1287840 [compost metagenome]